MYTLENLEANKKYEIKLVAFREDGTKGGESTPLRCKTLPTQDYLKKEKKAHKKSIETLEKGIAEVNEAIAQMQTKTSLQDEKLKEFVQKLQSENSQRVGSQANEIQRKCAHTDQGDVSEEGKDVTKVDDVVHLETGPSEKGPERVWFLVAILVFTLLVFTFYTIFAGSFKSAMVREVSLATPTLQWVKSTSAGVIVATSSSGNSKCYQAIAPYLGKNATSFPVCPGISTGLAIDTQRPVVNLEIEVEGMSPPKPLKISESLENGLVLKPSLSAGKERLIIADSTLRSGVYVWDSVNWSELGHLRGPVYCLEANTDGIIYAAGQDVHKWDGGNWIDMSYGLPSDSKITHIRNWQNTLVATLFREINPDTSTDIYLFDTENKEWVPHYTAQFSRDGVRAVAEWGDGMLLVAGTDFADESVGKISIFRSVNDHKPIEYIVNNGDDDSMIYDVLSSPDGLYIAGNFTQISNETDSWPVNGFAYMFRNSQVLEWVPIPSDSDDVEIHQLASVGNSCVAVGSFPMRGCRQFRRRCLAKLQDDRWNVIGRSWNSIDDIIEFNGQILVRIGKDGLFILEDEEWKPFHTDVDMWKRTEEPQGSESEEGVFFTHESEFGFGMRGRTLSLNVAGKNQVEGQGCVLTVNRFLISSPSVSEPDLHVLSLDSSPVSVLSSKGKGICSSDQRQLLIEGQSEPLCCFNGGNVVDMKNQCHGKVPLGTPIIGNDSWPVMVHYEDSKGGLNWVDVAKTPSHLRLALFEMATCFNRSI